MKVKTRFASKAQKMKAKGVYQFELKRANGQVEQWTEENIVVNEGINKALNIMGGLVAEIATWYIGIYEGSYTPVAGDTAATFPSSATETTAYVESTRRTWTIVTSTAQQLTNTASPGTFTFTSAKTIQGAFVTSNATIGATTGTLLSAVAFSSSKSVGIGDQLNVTYQLSMTSS